jgi:hypothetical protein
LTISSIKLLTALAQVPLTYTTWMATLYGLTGVVNGIRVYSSIFFFKIGGILDIEFLYFTIIKNMETKVCTF